MNLHYFHSYYFIVYWKSHDSDVALMYIQNKLDETHSQSEFRRLSRRRFLHWIEKIVEKSETCLNDRYEEYPQFMNVKLSLKLFY
jgi:hypothetical protein